MSVTCSSQNSKPQSRRTRGFISVSPHQYIPGHDFKGVGAAAAVAAPSPVDAIYTHLKNNKAHKSPVIKVFVSLIKVFVSVIKSVCVPC